MARLLRVFVTVVLAAAAVAGCQRSAPGAGESDSAGARTQARALGVAPAQTSGRSEIPIAPADPEMELTEAQWKERLTPAEFEILRDHGTEPAYSGDLLDEKREGTYVCAACGQELFASDTKFESGTGWPSFYTPIEGGVGTQVDDSLGMRRVEVHCSRCGGHLGHVFTDGPEPTGLRYCINSEAMDFEPAAQHGEAAE